MLIDTKKAILVEDEMSSSEKVLPGIQGADGPAKELARGEQPMAYGNKVNAYKSSDSGGGYSNAPQPGMPTYTEAWALIESARRIAVATDCANQDNIKDRNKVRDALRLNWRLWTIFQAEMTVDDRPDMNDEVRNNMLTLCKFVDKHTVEALKDPTPEKVGTLVEINRNIASGLLQSLENTAEGESQSAENTSDSDASADHAQILASVNASV